MELYAKSLKNSCLAVDRAALRENIAAIRSELSPGTAIWPVLKGNAYGLGLREVASVLTSIPGIDTLVTAHVSEGLALREDGFSGEILVLGNPLPAALAAGAAAGLTFTVGRLGLLGDLARESLGLGRAVKVQLKLDTGLHRVGAAPGEELALLLQELSAAGERIELRGVYSHFGDTARADLCAAQFERYLRGLDQTEKAGFDPGARHICDSAASELYPEYHLDAVRLGRRLMMDHPTAPRGNIRECAAWYGCVTDVHRRRAGDTLGYGGAYVLAHDADIAILSVGYGDGLPLSWADRHAPVLIRGQRRPLLACCMDQCFADVTGMGCVPGEEVVFFGPGLTSQEAARLCGVNEGCAITSALAGRVERVYVN